MGMSTLLQFDDEPQLTFHADDQRFLIKSHESAKRTLIIMPRIKETDFRQLFSSETNAYPSGKVIADALDRNFRTNLFVFFRGNRRLMFRLRFVEKAEADYVLRVKEIFAKGCAL